MWQPWMALDSGLHPWHMRDLTPGELERLVTERARREQQMDP